MFVGFLRKHLGHRDGGIWQKTRWKALSSRKLFRGWSLAKPSLCTQTASCQHWSEKFSKLANNKSSVQRYSIYPWNWTLETGPATVLIAAILAIVLKLCLETDGNILKIAACHETFALDDRSFAWSLSGLLQVRPGAHVFPFDSKVLAPSRGIMHIDHFASWAARNQRHVALEGSKLHFKKSLSDVDFRHLEHVFQKWCKEERLTIWKQLWSSLIKRTLVPHLYYTL